MRPLEELWKIIHAHTIKEDSYALPGTIGICGFINRAEEWDLITIDEEAALIADLQSYGKKLNAYYSFFGLKVYKIGLRSMQHMHLYYWTPTDIKPRLKWMKGRIKYHSKRKNNET